MMKKCSVIYVGLSGFPIGFAMIAKIVLISKALQYIGLSTLVINRKLSDESQYEGQYKGIRYTSVFNKRIHGSFLKRRFYNTILPFLEWKKISSEIKKNEVKYVIVNSRDLFQLILYFLLSRKHRTKLLITYVELGSAMITSSRKVYINNFLFEKYAFRIVDGALPISEHLIQIIRKQNSNLPILKTPVLLDFEEIDAIKTDRIENKFLFCGSAAFIEVLRMIIHSFELVKNDGTRLTLVCGGTLDETEALNAIIMRSPKKDKIDLLQKLSYSQLIENYKTSLALLIPLRPTIQDKARFPHKIGEYAASSRPIISNNWGEVTNYFEDNKSAFLAEKYTPESIAAKMNFVIENCDKAKEVGKAGRKVAELYFDYKKYSKQIKEYLESI